jgi:putative ABC transport system permease protein
MLKATLRTALAHKGRLILSMLAVILGVAFVTGTLMLTSALDRTFVDIIEGSAQDVQVTRESAVGVDLTTEPGDSAPLLVSQETVEQIKGVEGVAAAEGSVSRNGVYLIDQQGEVVGAVGPPALGLSWSADPQLSLATITQGHAPEANDQIVVDDTTFPEIGAQIGDQVKVLTPSGEISAQLAGTFRYGETGGLAGATLTFFTPERAQELLTEKGEWTAAEVSVVDGFTDQQVADSIASTLTDEALVVKTRAQQVEEESASLREGLAFFNYILIGFAAISLFVATFLIYNTFAILVAQRGQELALLRAIGATRVQVLRSVLVEALLMAIGAVIIGIGVGYLLAFGLAALFGSIGLTLSAGIQITLPAIVWATIVGIVVTLLAALIPAIRASRIAPVAALREAGGGGQEGVGKIRTIIGAVLLFLSIVLINFGLANEDAGARAGQTALGALLLLVAVVVLSPLLAVALVKVAGPLLRALGGTSGKLAARNAARSPRRLATTASALTIGLGLVVSVTIITSSAKVSIEELVDNSVKSEFLVQTLTQQPFDRAIAEEIRGIEGVEYVVSESGGSVEIDGEESGITAIGGGPLDATISVENVTGEFGDLSTGEAVVSQDLADEKGWSVGDTVTVLFSSGQERTFTIVGTYEESILLSGLVISLDDYREAGGAAQDRFLSIVLLPDADSTIVLAQTEEFAAANPLLEVLDQTEIKEQNAAQLNQLLYMVYAMLALSVIIAALGVVNTLALSVIERTREIGLLRAVGATRRQIRRIIRWEAVVVAVLGAILGIVVGIGAGVALQRALADSGIDTLAMPVGTLVIILIGAIFIGVLAAVLPARRAARLNVLESIATE